MPSPATTLQASNARSADVFQVHGFGVKSREQKCLRGPRSRKCRWLQGSSRCHSENPRFEDDKYRLRGTVRGICPSRPLRQRARPTPLSRLDTPRKIYAALNKEELFSGCLIYIIPPHQMKGKYINNTKVTKYSTLPFRGRRVISRYWREASIAFVWTSDYAGAQTFAVCGALPHTRFFLNFLITLPRYPSYSLPFSVLCVAE